MYNNKVTLFGAITLLVLALQGCGGGGSSSASGSSTPNTLGGTTAVGAPIVGATVNVTCASGPSLASTPTSSVGAWQVTLGTQTFPCAAQTSGGTINGSANTVQYHSLATAAGIMNITPLTDLIVANATGTTPATWFGGLSATSLAAITQTAVNTALAQVRTALALPQLANVNPLTTTFNPAAGNLLDDLLSSLQTALTAQSISFATLQTAATAGSAFAAPAGLATAYSTAFAASNSGGTGSGSGTGSGTGGTGGSVSAAPTASGTVTATNPAASFTPDASGFTVEVNRDTTKYKFIYNANSTSNQTIEIAVPRDGNTRLQTTVTYLAGFSSTLIYSCTSNCGVTVSQPAGTTHPVTITLTNTPLVQGISNTVVRNLTGSLVGDTGGALWQAGELPRTTTGSVTVGSIAQTVHTAIYTEGPGAGSSVVRSAELTLRDGSVAGLTQTDSGPVSVTYTDGVTSYLCISNCNATLSSSGGTVTATLANTPMITTSQGPTTTLSGTATIGSTSGSITATALGTFTPIGDAIESKNNTRTYTYSNFGAGSGITMVTATLRDGVVTSVTMVSGLSVQRACFETASALLGIPACSGVTLGSDGRSLTFNATTLSSGANQTVINGTLTARGL